MFKTRRIQRKRRGRRQKSLRPRNSFKAAKSKSQTQSKHVNDKDVSKELQIMGLRKDLFYSDKSVTTSYSWDRIFPLMNFNRTSDLTRSVKLCSLKELCVNKIAQEADHINPSLLEDIPSRLCLDIWKKILFHHNDSFGLYMIFTNKLFNVENKLFTSQEFFENPPSYNESLGIARNNAIIMNRPIRGKFYRSENLFANVSLDEFVKQITKCQFPTSILLDLSYMNPKHFNYDDYFMIFNIPNLRGLDLSNNDIIDDSFLNSLCNAIKYSKLPKLSSLLINNCPRITQAGLNLLLAVRRNTDLNCILTYIESDYKIDEMSCIKYKWKRDSALISYSKLSLGLKSFSKFDHKKSDFKNPQNSFQMDLKLSTMLYNSLVLDFVVQSENYVPGSIETNSLTAENGWKRRTLTKPLSRHVYIHDSNMPNTIIERNKKRESTIDQLGIDYDQKIVTNVIPNKKKAKSMMKADAKSFFSI